MDQPNYRGCMRKQTGDQQKLTDRLSEMQNPSIQTIFWGRGEDIYEHIENVREICQPINVICTPASNNTKPCCGTGSSGGANKDKL